ncbi:ABC transporter permease subunit [Hylemonella sp. W303a]|uniref:ABC transporter permease subunit n=1 Tax=Hylemonella sp. W303a TaxID=3389873 RepID=UPI00396B2F39
MRFLRFLALELGLRGVVFTLVGTLALVGLYLASIGAPAEQYMKTLGAFWSMVTLNPDFSLETAGFSAGEIISSGAAITFPLALVSLLFLVVIALVGASASASSTYLRTVQGGSKSGGFGAVGGLLASILSAVPLFVGFWLLYGASGMSPSPMLIALVVVALGGLGWDATRFLTLDMKRQIDTTHTLVFSTLGPAVGRALPLPGTVTGYLLNSAAPRFIPYVAGKVPAIIGGVTIAEMVFNFPGLGSTLLDALVNMHTDTLIAAVFVLLAVNALVTFLVKSALFVLYPRWYEKAL